MPDYLEATAFAVERLTGAVWYERDEFEKSQGFVRQEVDEDMWNAFLAAIMSGEDDESWSIYPGLGVSQFAANQAATQALYSKSQSRASQASTEGRYRPLVA
jgi:hypothetical protein